MELKKKTFAELTTRELYEILKARAAIFVVEQVCVYQDLDDKDYESLHLFYEEDGKVLAYARIFPKEGEAGTMQMGRVMTLNHGQGLGGKLLKEAIAAVREMQNAAAHQDEARGGAAPRADEGELYRDGAAPRTSVRELYIEAQEYAKGYYEREGFRVTSPMFLEDGIPHVEMRLAL